MGMCGDTPETPDYAEAARNAVYADINTLPTRRMVEAASRLGEKVTVGGKTYDFTGLGDADYQGDYAEQMAQSLIDIQKEYGSAYVTQRLKELQLADPEGTAMRKQLYERIIAQMNESPDQPLSEEAQASILKDLQSAPQLDSTVARQIQQGVRGGQFSRGNYLGSANVAQEAGAMTAGAENQETNRMAMAGQYLQAGITPEDVAYRRRQQSMSNLGAFMSGTTPTAQFSQLSGAQQGATPFMSGGTMASGLSQNAAAMGTQNAANLYKTQVDWNAQQVNPYFAGIGTGAQVLGTAGKLGFSFGG